MVHSPFSDTLRYQIGKKSLHILCIYKYIYIYIPSVLTLYPEYGRYIIHFHLHPNIISSCFCKVIWKCKIFHDYPYWSHLDLECTYIYNIHMCVCSYTHIYLVWMGMSPKNESWLMGISTIHPQERITPPPRCACRSHSPTITAKVQRFLSQPFFVWDSEFRNLNGFIRTNGKPHATVSSNLC